MGNYYFDLPEEIQEMIFDIVIKLYQKTHIDKFSPTIKMFNIQPTYGGELTVKWRMECYEITEEKEKNYPWEYESFDVLTYHQYIMCIYHNSGCFTKGGMRYGL